MATQRDARYRPEQRVKAAKLYKAGHSTLEVADEMGLSRTRVMTLLDEAGVERRPRGRPRKTDQRSRRAS